MKKMFKLIMALTVFSVLLAASCNQDITIIPDDDKQNTEIISNEKIEKEEEKEKDSEQNEEEENENESDEKNNLNDSKENDEIDDGKKENDNTENNDKVSDSENSENTEKENKDNKNQVIDNNNDENKEQSADEKKQEEKNKESDESDEEKNPSEENDEIENKTDEENKPDENDADNGTEINDEEQKGNDKNDDESDQDVTEKDNTVENKNGQETEEIKDYENNPLDEKKWTIMVYMPSYSDTEQLSEKVINQIEAEIKDDEMNVIVLTDLGEAENSRTKLYRIRKDDEVNDRIISEEIFASSMKLNDGKTKLNLASDEVLKQFVSHAKGAFPAEKYGIVFWNRTTDQEKHLNKLFTLAENPENGTALTATDAAKSVSSVYDKFEFILLDQSFGGCIENAAEFRNTADVFAGYEGPVYDKGIDYEKWLNTFDTEGNGQKNITELSSQLPSKANFCAVDLKYFQELIEKLDAFYLAAAEKCSVSSNQIKIYENVFKSKYIYKNTEASVLFINVEDFTQKIRNKYYAALDVTFVPLKEIYAKINLTEKETLSMSMCICKIDSEGNVLNEVPEALYVNEKNPVVVNLMKNVYPDENNPDAFLSELFPSEI